MKTKLHISMNNAEGAMVRLLGTMERRGHRLLGINSAASALGGNMQDLSVELDCGERSPEVLMRQLERLHDVQAVRYQRHPEALRTRSRQETVRPIIRPAWEMAHG